MRNPNTESVQVFNELLDEGGVSSPWYANVVAPDLVAADALAHRLHKLYRNKPLDEAIPLLAILLDMPLSHLHMHFP